MSPEVDYTDYRFSAFLNQSSVRKGNSGWGSQADKRVISDFEILNVSSHLTYYSNGEISVVEPATATEMAATWSVLHTTIYFQRHSVMFGVCMLLPCLVSQVFVKSTGLSSYIRAGDSIDLNQAHVSFGVLKPATIFPMSATFFMIQQPYDNCLFPSIQVSAAFNILPFFLTSLNYSVYTLLSNVIIQAIFLQEMVNGMPLSANRVPKSGKRCCNT
ncbi:hypothetical protein COOONC_21935 [Cooperia oncophora]